MKIKKVKCYFSSNVDILGVYGNEMVIDGWINDEENDEDYWGIVVNIDEYKKGLVDGMKQKREYCEVHGYNCGVGVIFGECEMKQKELGGELYYDCTGVEWEVDLEHG